VQAKVVPRQEVRERGRQHSGGEQKLIGDDVAAQLHQRGIEHWPDVWHRFWPWLVLLWNRLDVRVIGCPRGRVHATNLAILVEDAHAPAEQLSDGLSRMFISGVIKASGFVEEGLGIDAAELV